MSGSQCPLEFGDFFSMLSTEFGNLLAEPPYQGAAGGSCIRVEFGTVRAGGSAAAAECFDLRTKLGVTVDEVS